MKRKVREVISKEREVEADEVDGLRSQSSIAEIDEFDRDLLALQEELDSMQNNGRDAQENFDQLENVVDDEEDNLSNVFDPVENPSSDTIRKPCCNCSVM